MLLFEYFFSLHVHVFPLSAWKDAEDVATLADMMLEEVKMGPVFQRNAQILSVRCSNLMAAMASEVTRNDGEYECVRV